MLRSLLIVTSIVAISSCGANAENKSAPAGASAMAKAEVSTDIRSNNDGDVQTHAKWQPEDGDVISYKVLRKGKKFGKHSVRFTRDGDVLTATTDVALEAGLGPIKIFTYTLNAAETWKDGALVTLTGKVDDDGKEGNVDAKRDGETLIVKGTKYQGEAPAGIIPASHWNFAQMQSTQLLSTEDGELLDVKVTDQGRETIKIAGQDVEATRYLMDSDIDVELWYDDDGRWVKLAFEARGQEIEYLLTDIY